MLLTKQYLNEMSVKMKFYDSLFEAKTEHDLYDVFISYSWNDRIYASKVAKLLESCGYKVYIDFKDQSLDRSNVNLKAVKIIAGMMDKCKSLIYLHSPSASVSKWCPWELGYVSGKKKFKCLYLPLLDKQGEYFKNQEYLKIYPYGSYAKVEGKEVFEFWVNNQNNDKQYTTLKRWLNGGELTLHK